MILGRLIRRDSVQRWMKHQPVFVRLKQYQKWGLNLNVEILKTRNVERVRMYIRQITKKF